MKKLTWMILLLLAGCGGGGDVVISFPGPEPVPEPAADAFFAEVTRVIAAMPEDAEAAAIDSMTVATAPEDSESISL